MAGIIWKRRVVAIAATVLFLLPISVFSRLSEPELFFEDDLAGSHDRATDSPVRRRRLQFSVDCVYLVRFVRYADDDQPEENTTFDDCFIEDLGYFALGGPGYQTIKSSGVGDTLVSGESTLRVKEGTEIVDGVLMLPEDDDPVIGRRPQSNFGGGRRRLSTTGPKKVLALRVVATDGSPSFSEGQLRDDVFLDSVSLRSQYNACSHGQLDMQPFTGRTIGGPSINGGVASVSIPRRADGENELYISASARVEAEKLYGNLEAQVDHLMLCLPPDTRHAGSRSWVAYAHLNWYISVFNDDWCRSVSSQMHELGHNMGLAHSGERNDEYDDRTGVMGQSYNEDDTSMCFNGAKTWQLGWFRERQLQINVGARSFKGWIGEIVGSSDFSSFERLPDARVILKLVGGTVDHYVSFNRQVNSNSDTQEGENQITIQTTEQRFGFEQSWLVAKLGAGEEYLFDVGDLEALVRVITINNNGVARVSILVACAGDMANFAPACGDGVCEIEKGENCFSCSKDCNRFGKNDSPFSKKKNTKGWIEENESRFFCCASTSSGVNDAVGCFDPRCFQNGKSCSSVGPTHTSGCG